MSNGKFGLLETFKKTFEHKIYKHRNSTLGNKIGRTLFEDLFTHRVSPRYNNHIAQGRGVVNVGGKIHTPKSIRRNDSIFGKPPAGEILESPDKGFSVPKGSVAEPRIGCEVKIIAKSQQKQIDRVISDLDNFVSRMKALNRKCINVAIVGINHESNYVGREGKRTFKHILRTQEPTTVKEKLSRELSEKYDEVLVLKFKVTNQIPYPFEWLDYRKVDLDYGAALTRVGELYQERFR